MAIEIKVPTLPESVADATIAAWHKKPGDLVTRNENLVDIETDKVVLEVVAPADGTLEKILKDTGSVVKAEEVIGLFASVAIAQSVTQQPTITTTAQAKAQDTVILTPSERRSLSESRGNQSVPDSAFAPALASQIKIPPQPTAPLLDIANGRLEKRVPMTRLRAKIAERLLAAQQNAAILTTFNEINMAPVIALRNSYKDEFLHKYNVRLGYMSFFVTAVVAALKRFPAVNASIDGNDIVYHGYFDIGIAVSTERGLVVPILRDANTLTMAEIEQKIAAFGKSAKEGKLTMEEITGGTFTITNGGVFGSLMATPILNPPQSGILGIHKIEERPVVENKQIVIRPMMYVALSYDHRIIDGAESVQFLVAIKELIEDPARLLLSV